MRTQEFAILLTLEGGFLGPVGSSDTGASMMSSRRRIGLFLETIVFTVFVPGVVAFWLPMVVLDDRRLALPVSWSVARFVALLPSVRRWLPGRRYVAPE